MLDILDVAIGLAFVYLLLSLVVTAANELFAAWFKRRAWMLWKGVTNLLDDEALATAFYDHPLIRSLKQTDRGPSYIPSRTFAIALLDLVAPLVDGKRTLPTADQSQRTVPRTLRLLWEEADADVDKFKENIEVWFNNSMERVSGWYKRRTQIFLLMWAAVVTVGANADTIVISRALWRDPVLRQTLAQQAQRYVAEQQPPPEPESDEVPGPPPLPPDLQADADYQAAEVRLQAAIDDLNELDLPIGWEDREAAGAARGLESLRVVRDDASDDWPGAIWPFDGVDELGRWLKALDDHTLGWLLTIFAISMGAPFWFDMLNKIVSIRTAGKAPEESPKSPKKVPTPKEPGDEP